MSDTITLEWTFTPPDFFEEPFTHKGETCTFEVDNGKVVGRPIRTEEPEQTQHKKIHDELDALFLGAQLKEYRDYTLSQDPAIVRTRQDGTRSIAGQLRASAVMTMGAKYPSP
jgi:hypothetical protein